MPQKDKRTPESAGENHLKEKKILQIRSFIGSARRGTCPSGRCPGVGKTTTALALSRLMGMEFNRIQFTPDVVPSDVTGFTMYDKTERTVLLS